MKFRSIMERLSGKSRNASWTKSPTLLVRISSVARTIFIWAPLAIFFEILESLIQKNNKNNIIFLLPYREFCENTRFLFDYWLHHKDSSLNPLLFVFDRELFINLKTKYSNNIIYARSISGLIIFLHSRLAFTSRGGIKSNFFPYCFLKRHKIFINLWHGIPLKRLGWQSRDTWEKYFSHEMQRYSAHIVCSEAEQINIAACYRMNIDNIWITNAPRNDALFRHETNTPENLRTIIYAPTWRDGNDPVEFFPFADFELAVLDQWLEARGLRMMLRAHLVERSDHSLQISKFENSKNLYIDRDDKVSLQEKLLAAKILITDYSSIYLDYLALDRPIIFIPYDLKAYDEKRGFLFDYGAVTPGPKVLTFIEFLEAMERAVQDPTWGSEARSNVRKIMHAQQDGNASQRIHDRAISILQRN